MGKGRLEGPRVMVMGRWFCAWGGVFRVQVAKLGMDAG